MRSNCLTIVHVFVLVTLVLTLDADGKDLNCETEIKVRRNTVYEAVVGQELRINCTVVFCNNSQTVYWFKFEKTPVPVNISSGSHIKTDWITLKHFRGISSLIFKNILSSDSGQYRCQSGGSVSHTINVSVHDHVESTTMTWTLEPENLTQDSLWHYVYSAVGVIVFVIIVTSISIALMKACEGVHCAKGSRTTTDPNPEASDHESDIYENDM
ncbi:B- and T-lymphocyte attenuator-like isoform X2 [Anabas testudineus]|uniref:B- and T-lymphocyte attenuator-like isoform X2 n=1 Tax=Anabas testudineus TaxID=64144 RepID=UPI000E463B5E|nr:B- and T-lymphocyte attenuator-like isoform X2 [Anabas testudineus]